MNHHPAVCRATSASASVCESCVCLVVAVWSRVRRRFGSSAGRILNVYTYTYTYVYVRACNCVRLNMISRVPGILHIVNLELRMNGCAARPVRWCTSRETCAHNMAHHHVGCCARALCACGCEEESAQCRKWFGFGKVRYMHVLFFGFLFFGDRVRVHVAAHAGGGGGKTDLATRGARYVRRT